MICAAGAWCCDARKPKAERSKAMLRDGTAEKSADVICKGKEQNHKRIIEVKKWKDT